MESSWAEYLPFNKIENEEIGESTGIAQRDICHERVQNASFRLQADVRIAGMLLQPRGRWRRISLSRSLPIN